MTSADTNDNRKPCYSDHDFYKAVELAKALKYAKDQAEIKRKALAEAISQPHEEEFRFASSTIQNKQIRLRIQKEEIKLVTSRVHRAQLRLSCLEEKLENKAEHTIITASIGTNNEKTKSIEETSKSLRKQLVAKKHELLFRRRFLIFELYTIYFAETSIYRRQDRTCFCNKYDAIRGMHLPIIATKDGHTEVEITAAISHLVNAVRIFCGILDYTFMVPLFFKGSRSFLVEPKSNQIYNLFDPFSRSHRERYANAVSFFNRAIIQLRCDLGMVSKDLERPIQNLQETLLYCMGQVNLPPSRLVPSHSIYSISSVVPDLRKLSVSDRAHFQAALKKRNKSREDEDSILDVVSSKNETFDVQKLVSRSLT